MQLLPGMQLLPLLQIGLLNGWILLVIFYITELILVLAFPKERRGRLFEYDHSKWSKRHRGFLIVGKSFSLILIILLILTPLSLGTLAFCIGLIIYFIGLIGFVIALVNFRNTPLNQPVTQGMYRFSRNPQVLTIFILMTGITFTVGSWIALLIGLLAAIFGRARIIEEEKACLNQYGDAYRKYMEQVPRYLFIKTKLKD